MSSFRIETWAAIAPGLKTRTDWGKWLRNPVAIDEPLGNIAMPGVPALLRRRFSTLGKGAMAAAMPLVEEVTEIPSIFASRHGDTPLSLSLLEGIARNEPMSPTSFSLAVHNAVSGLFSIVRKDTSAVTAIAAVHGLVLQTLFEALGQLQTSDRMLCVIYDIPLPDFYQAQREEAPEPFPYAVAMILGNHQGEAFRLEATPRGELDVEQSFDFEALGLLRLLSGITDHTDFMQQQTRWKLIRTRC
ncbi:MAG: beta-ketoacyl synthase chain length factor [Gammaproteobacteria bacterium]|nr:beta-ketoacyl synthase chain length factor [Gammaproteobacteria bacterium]